MVISNNGTKKTFHAAVESINEFLPNEFVNENLIGKVAKGRYIVEN